MLSGHHVRRTRCQQQRHAYHTHAYHTHAPKNSSPMAVPQSDIDCREKLAAAVKPLGNAVVLPERNPVGVGVGVGAAMGESAQQENATTVQVFFFFSFCSCVLCCVQQTTSAALIRFEHRGEPVHRFAVRGTFNQCSMFTIMGGKCRNREGWRSRSLPIALRNIHFYLEVHH